MFNDYVAATAGLSRDQITNGPITCDNFWQAPLEKEQVQFT